MLNRNFLYLAIAAMAVVGVALGYQSYQERQKPGIKIDVGNSSVSVQSK